MSIAEHVAIQKRFDELETKLVNLNGVIQHLLKRLDNLNLKNKKTAEAQPEADHSASREATE